MAIYECKNFGFCSRADEHEEFSLAAGTDHKCPGCTSTLVRTGEGVIDEPTDNRTKILIASISGVVLLGLAVIAFINWKNNRPPSDIVAETIPAKSDLRVASAPISPVRLPESKKSEQPGPVTASETYARKTCDDATKAKQADALKICNHAAAITLMNSGVLSALEGRLDSAEKDYLAAKDKDPDFPELYFNIALLKARQNKGSEAIDNLNLAKIKGFRQFSAIKSEPVLQKLKSDPAFKSKVEAFEIN